MQMKKISTIFLKELKDTLRDRRTLMFMLVVPIVAMPLLMTVSMKLMVGQARKIEAEKATVAVQRLDQLPQVLQDSLKASAVLDLKTEADFAGKDLISELKQGTLRAVLIVPENFSKAIELESPTDLELYVDNGEERSTSAADKVKDILSTYKDHVVEARLVKRSISTELIKPFETIRNNVATAQKQAGRVIGGIIPYIIILMSFLGAMYPASDLAAGEKERGTMETLLVAPATRGEFVMGKYLVILLTAMVTGLLAMVSMTYSINKMMGDMSKEAGMTSTLAIQFDVQTIILILMIVIPLAGIFAAVLLSVSVFAKSSKEAQTYMGALNMVLVFPAFAALIPGVQLSYTMALIPIANIALIIKYAISGTIEWKYVITAFVSLFALAAVALYFTKRWFEREEVLFRM